MAQDIRWQQRFQNFNKAFTRLKEALSKESLNELERNGLIKRFELTIELGWKTLKDFLENQGFEVKSPKETIRQAFQSGYIKDGQLWLDILEWRNRLSHDYSEEYFKAGEKKIRNDFIPVFEHLHKFFISEINKDQTNLFNNA